jgi:hypothetical protein
MNKTIISVLLVAVLAGGGGFYGGMQYEQSQGGANFPGPGFVQGGGPRGGNVGPQNGQFRPDQGGLSLGEVISVDETNMVIQLPNNAGTKIVFYSDSTKVSKQASGSIADVVVGGTVTIVGESNDDGSIVANTIQLVPKQQ